MELQHWIDEHPLTLSEVKNRDGVEIVCIGCLQNITGGSSAYGCTDCSFFLHKLCAKLPRQIKHPMYPEKTLTLHLDPPDELPTLDLDNKLDDEQLSIYFSHNLCHQNFYGFNYFEDTSSACGAFTIDIRCAARSISVEHEFHEHPLSPILSPALFGCHACCTQHDKGLSYMCCTCDFWIHEDCALLPTTFKYRGHVHPLTLYYSSLYDASCRICQEGFRNYQWSYQCRGCQYHAHANYATKTKEIETVTGVEELDMTNLFHLPMLDESINLFNQFVEQLNVPTVNLIDQFVEQLNLEHASNKIEAKLYNSIHSHPLILFDVDSEDNLCSMSKLSIHNDEQKNEKICDACVQPILVPFYSCSHSQCDFFMHKCCVELPIEIQHPCHPHPLSLDNRSSYFGWFTCRGCGKQCNGFTFQCTTDECTFNETFYLDVKCASLPSCIVHEFHEHPLRLRPNCTIEGCVACDQCNSTCSYGCGICNFHLHSNCALLPRTIKHRYYEHPFSLIYAPIKDGPDEYICEFCEEDIDPKWWFYHCIDCDQSACAKCIYKEEKEYSNIKLGITKKFNSHPHPLDLVQVVNKSWICDKCEQKIFRVENGIAYMCVQCNTKLHVDCILFHEMFCNT